MRNWVHQLVGLIIIFTLVFFVCKLHNIYIVDCNTLWMGTIGFIDIYIKSSKKR
jgi:hypothetical protein